MARQRKRLAHRTVELSLAILDSRYQDGNNEGGQLDERILACCNSFPRRNALCFPFNRGDPDRSDMTLTKTCRSKA